VSVPYNPDDDEWFGPLPENVVIGKHCYLYSSWAFRHCASERECAVRLASNVNVYPETCFELGPEGEVTVGEYTTLSDLTISTNARVSIGGYGMLGWEVVIADTSYAVPPASRGALGDDGGAAANNDVVVADNVWVGARAVLLGGARIGEGSVIGAGSVVDFEVPPRSIAAGNPGRVVGPIGTSAR
jgi:acetyltransferase-like isoleucine patch superfamily enzyme